jgi:type IV secretory pathway TraG/TraD family ATPase VirD4
MSGTAKFEPHSLQSLIDDGVVICVAGLYSITERGVAYKKDNRRTKGLKGKWIRPPWPDDE